MIPNDRKYTPDHEWVKIEGGLAYVGITDHAQEELGDIVFCELPDEGAEFARGDSFAVVESVKAASDIYAPVTGRIDKVNMDLADAPEKLNDAPYDAFIAVFAADAFDEGELLDAAAYAALIEG